MGPSRPWIDSYAFVAGNQALMLADGIHGYGHLIAAYILSWLVGRALGRRESDSRAGQGLVYCFNLGTPQDYMLGAINRIPASAGDAGYPLFTGARTDSGEVDPFVALRVGGFANGNSGGDGAGALARVADTRFHDATLLGGSIYMQGAAVCPLVLDAAPTAA